MSDKLEPELRAALTERAARLSPDVVERLARIDYHPQPRRRPHRLGVPPGLAAGGAALAAGIIIAILLLSSSAPPAFAGWTPTPTTPTRAAVAGAAAACRRIAPAGAAPIGQPVLTDARGRYTALLYAAGDRAYDCISDGDPDHTQGGSSLVRFHAAPGPDQLGLPRGGGGSAPGFSRSASPAQPLPPQFQRLVQQVRNPTLRAMREANLRRMVDGGLETHLYGRTGSDISAVTFLFADGATVSATVEHGWYFAWWPSDDDPSSVHVTTKSGATISSQMPGRGPGCKPGTSRCVFAGRLPWR